MEQQWITTRLQNGEEQSLKVGPLRIFMKKVLNEIWVSYRHTEEAEETLKPEWSRWALMEDIAEFSLWPCFPDRPIVVKPEYPFHISKGASARIFSRVPVFVRITPKDYPDFVITEIPTVVLSNTWFGTVTEGELCYWLSTTARRELRPELLEQHTAVCTMQITNNAKEQLNFDNICLRVERLSMFLNDGIPWADQTDITFQGGERFCDIEMKGRLPEEAKGGTLITSPRSDIKKTFATRTFQFFREIPGFSLT